MFVVCYVHRMFTIASLVHKTTLSFFPIVARTFDWVCVFHDQEFPEVTYLSHGAEK